MAYFPYLPEELLNQIFSNCVSAVDEDLDPDSVRTLQAISLTSKQFHRIVEPSLYSNVLACFAGLESEYYPFWLVNGPRLQRTFAERPALSSYVKTFRAFRIRADEMRYGEEHTAKQEVYRDNETTARMGLVGSHVPRILEGMPNLERVDFRKTAILYCHGLCYWLFGSELSTGKMSNLRRLDITLKRSTLVDLLPIFQLPKLEVFVADIVYLYAPDSEDRAWFSLRTSVRELTMRTFFWDTRTINLLSAFRIVLDACPLLRAFRLSLHGNPDEEFDEEFQAGIIGLLNVQLSSGTLRHLELWSKQGLCGPYEMLNPPSLPNVWTSASLELESLKVDMSLLSQNRFNTGYPGIRASIESVVPQSVRHLTLRHAPCRESRS
ncbi:hypothetical protein BU26DRAFT_523089 [Trematosphaeria pertusa]|uniref:Uncharacterized protein n=1 Tax=Trematosphaeria pertusa TaxID=390896 RepID=A0A6A6I279_9PLEO|nr:uncharacterized protein BU26DRAFT_523089 [Trematosphaeria pertusa]KAF2244441.1 hypothetical protein BU26DRAFT_523089 [Trematosphaeria pertusa]